MTELCLVRHGETAWNAEHRVQGQLDTPLSEIGQRQALAVARVLVAGGAGRFAALYSSDLARARDTAAPTAHALRLEIRVEPRLRERHYGVFERLTYAECERRYPGDYARFLAHDPEFDFRTGESLRAFYERAVGCLEEIAARHPGEGVLVFTHGGVLDKLYRRVTGMPLTEPRDFRIPNGGLNRVEARREGWRILSWAEESHLEGALDDLPE
jgi:probable phosphoglycerate mutase